MGRAGGLRMVQGIQCPPREGEELRHPGLVRFQRAGPFPGPVFGRRFHSLQRQAGEASGPPRHQPAPPRHLRRHPVRHVQGLEDG